MKINRVILRSFGKFKDKEVSFSDGLNIIYGGNEAGKTTLNAAVKTALYPLSGSQKENREKTCFIPVNEKKAEWSILFSDDSGRQYETFFAMGKTRRGCAQRTIDRLLGTELKMEEDSLGEHFFHMPEEMFDNLAFLRDKTMTEWRNASMVHFQLAANNQEEPEEVDAVKKLSAAITLIERKNNRLDKLYDNRNELLDKKRELKEKEKAFARLKQHIAEVNEEKETVEKELKELLRLIGEVEAYDKYEKLKSVRHLQAQIEEGQKKLDELRKEKRHSSFLEGLTIEELSRCEATESELDRTEQEVQKNSGESQYRKMKKYGWLSVFQLVLSIAFAAMAFLSPIIFFILTIVGLAGCGFFYLKYRQYKRLYHSSEKERTDLLKNRQILLDQLAEALEKYQCKNVVELREKYQHFQELTHQIQIVTLSLENDKRLLETMLANGAPVEWKDSFPAEEPGERAEDLSALKNRKEALEYRMSELKIRLAGLTEKMLNFRGDMELGIRVEEELVSIDEDISSLLHRLEILKKTKSYMEQAKENLKKGYLPRLNAEVKRILSTMGAERFEQIYIDENMDVAVKEESLNFLKSGLQLSMGTRDQIHFALRLAVWRLAFAQGERVPLFLDDPFVRLDDSRFQEMMKFLSSYGDTQILYFTCHKRALDVGDVGTVTEL